MDNEKKTSVTILVAIIGALALIAVPFVSRLVDIYLPVPTASVSQISEPVNNVPTNNMPSAPIPTSPLSGSDNAVVTTANQKCQEFGGTSLSASSITLIQISKWRVGQVDKPTVGRIIYCEIHQVPGYFGFVEGDVIPENAIITADLGFSWDSQYPQSLERLAHEGGGWGVFLTLKPITVQHANDLDHSVAGQYWLISR
jgi:hypothetical protein